MRGGRQAVIDLELGFPGAMILMTLGKVGRPVLTPLALRTTPLPNRTRATLLVGLVGAGAAVGLRLRGRRRANRHSWPRPYLGR